MENRAFSEPCVKSLKFGQADGVVVRQVKQTKIGVSHAGQPINSAI
jgi:hypothetical protein